jgi:hypothetical protein
MRSGARSRSIAHRSRLIHALCQLILDVLQLLAIIRGIVRRHGPLRSGMRTASVALPVLAKPYFVTPFGNRSTLQYGWNALLD